MVHFPESPPDLGKFVIDLTTSHRIKIFSTITEKPEVDNQYLMTNIPYKESYLINPYGVFQFPVFKFVDL